MGNINKSIKAMIPGSQWNVREGGSVTVVEYINFREVLVRHNDKYMFEQIVQAGNLINGRLKNPYHRSIFSVGYIGVGHYIVSVNCIYTLAYVTWTSMLGRCYSPNIQLRSSSYIGYTVDPEWHNFQVFAEWYCNQPHYNKGYHLDKDLLSVGVKIYSPSTCCLIPDIINIALITRNGNGNKYPPGVSKNNNQYTATIRRGGKPRIAIGCKTVEQAALLYKIKKEEYVHQLADEYKDVITVKVYKALLKWKVI